MDGAVGELDGNQREVTGILRENGIKLQRLIENLLSFSAWQTSSASLDSSEFRLRPLVKQVLENQQLTLLSQRVRLDVKIEDVTLIADRGKVRLILENLLSNAVKYSPKGGAIHMSAAQSGEDLVLDVADNGPGIPPEDRAHIFEAFYTGQRRQGRQSQGHRHRAFRGARVRECSRRHRADRRWRVPRRALPHHHAHPLTRRRQS